MNEPALNKETKPVETLAAAYVKTFLATGMAYELTAESIAHRSFVDGYTEGAREVGQLKAALALGQENCDAEYDELREERDEARAQLAVALTAANAEELRKAQAELARVKAERDEAKEHLDAIDDVMGKIGQRAHWQDCEGLALFFRHTLDLFPKTRNFNDVEQAVAALRQDKERLDWVEDFFARNTERSIIRQQFARDLRSIGFRAAINVAMKEVRHG